MKIHQGDVLLVPVRGIPKGVRSKEIVQRGEITGHAHRIKNAVITEIKERKFVEVDLDSIMTHEDHPSVKIPKGKYEVIIQEEYFPEGNKKVMD